MAYRDIVLNPSGGNVAIGGTPIAPARVSVYGDNSTYDSGQLVVFGASNANQRLSVGFDTAGNTGFVQSLVAGTGYYPLLLNPHGGNVGVGTAAPIDKLDVQGGIHSRGTANASAANDAILDQYAGGLRLIANGPDGATNGLFHFYSQRADSTNPIQWLQSDGSGNAAFSSNVGVGGNVVVAGTISSARGIAAVYQDVAEWVPSGEELPAGTVVVLDREHDNQVRPSDHAYDTAVAGVVSARPGIVLGESAATKSRVATTGRVEVKVDASRAAVHIGDLLVTSDVAGEAMKSEPITVEGIAIHRPGTVIGKALQALPGGRGEILVLLSLQ